MKVKNIFSSNYNFNHLNTSILSLTINLPQKTIS